MLVVTAAFATSCSGFLLSPPPRISSSAASTLRCPLKRVPCSHILSSNIQLQQKKVEQDGDGAANDDVVAGPPEYVFFVALGGLALCLQALSKAAAGEYSFSDNLGVKAAYRHSNDMIKYSIV